jgi:hypothetical protein
MGEIIQDYQNPGLGVSVTSGHALVISGQVGVVFDPTDTLSITPSGTFYSSVTQSGNFLIVSGEASVTQATNPWIVLGSQTITNFPTTFPGSVIITNNPVPVSGTITVTSENVPYDSNEQLTGMAGSPSANTFVFTGGVVKTAIIKCAQETYVNTDAVATINSFPVGAGESVSADFQTGSVSALYKSSVGSVWIWGGR